MSFRSESHEIPSSVLMKSCHLFVKSNFGYVDTMIKPILLSALALLLLSAATPAVPQTMRLDYYHTGDAKQEMFSVDRVVIEPLPWPGDLSKNIDDTNLAALKEGRFTVIQ